MSYCQRCGEKNLSSAQFCENCGASLPPKDRELLQPGYGYDIHEVNCRHGLKLEPMRAEEKLCFLGRKKLLYLGNLLLILLEGLLLTANLLRTDNPLWQDFLKEKTGLFGPRGLYFTCLYCLLLMVVLLIAARPLYTRHPFDGRQLLPAMVAECGLIGLLLVSDWFDLYFGTFMGTGLTALGFLLIGVCMAALGVQCLLIREYRCIKRSGVYCYVAN